MPGTQLTGESPGPNTGSRPAAARTPDRSKAEDEGHDFRPFLRFLVCLFGFPLLFAPGSALAQSDIPLPSRGNLYFTADVGTTRAADGGDLAQVYLEIPWSSLRFSKAGPDWSASADITIVVYGRKNEQVTGDLWTVPILSPVDPSPASGRGSVYRRRFEFPIVPGRLRFEITVAQTDTGREGTWTYTIEVPGEDERPLRLSAFVFGLCTGDSSSTVADWSEAGFAPWPRRRYGDENPVVCVKGELYDGTAAPDSVYRLKCQILNGNGHGIATWTEEVPRDDGRGEFLIHPSIVDLTLGSYRLRLSAEVGREKARRERWFEIDESRVNIFDDPRMIRSVLGYIAQNHEILRLEDLPGDSLQAFWDDFWLRRDPTPGTPKNERLSEFLRRLEHVNQRFSIMEPGWSSDMGRIYIRYGAPDEIDRTPYSSAGPPREVWYYLERGLRFEFQDREGFGRYRLVGNISDWRQ